MPRRRNISMKAANLVLDRIAGLPVGSPLPPASVLAQHLNVSRTAMRSVFAYLADIGVVTTPSGPVALRRPPAPGDYHDAAETESRSDLVERQFLAMALAGGLMPGQHFSESELARRFGASTVSVREFLIGFSHYRLVQKAPRGGWRLCAFDEAFARELAATRKLFEMEALQRFAELAPGDPVWVAIDALAAEHRAMASSDDDAIRQFPRLDRMLHRFLVGQLDNRFVDGLYDVVSFVFHYHYQWRRDDELARYRTALSEHIAILAALRDRDIVHARAKLAAHLETSIRTLLASAIPAGGGSARPLVADGHVSMVG